MRRPRIAAVAASFSLALLLTLSHAAFGQRAPGVRMRGHFGGPVPHAGAFIGRGRLIGMPRGTLGPIVGPFHRGFVDGRFDGRFRNRFSFPDHRGFFGFPGRPFGLFGFPRHQLGFFFFNGFGFFSGFPFFDGFLVFDGFPPDHVGLFDLPRRHLGFRGFRSRRFGLLGQQTIPVGAPLGFTPYFSAWSSYGYPYASTGGTYGTDTSTAREMSRVSDTRSTLGRQLAVPSAGGTMGDTLLVEQESLMDIVPRTVLRLTWRNRGLDAAQVALFLADTAQGVLAAQTLRSPPFTALFEPPPGMAFAGMTVVWPDGTVSTRLVPYRRQAR